ncbi:MAG TPA: type IX secretion system membrane protein PorP/SprF, partial [Bacteroidales bacterium]
MIKRAYTSGLLLLTRSVIRILWLWLVFMTITPVIAQQQPAYSQYTFNGFLLNPAVAGSEGYTSINVTTREQWVGIEG